MGLRQNGMREGPMPSLGNKLPELRKPYQNEVVLERGNPKKFVVRTVGMKYADISELFEDGTVSKAKGLVKFNDLIMTGEIYGV